MNVIQFGEPVKLGKNTYMYFKADESVPEDSMFHWWSETVYDGKPDSYRPGIPLHWHKEHDAYVEVSEGTLDFHLQGKELKLEAGHEPLYIGKSCVHGFQFIQGTRTILKEFTGENKEDFFRDMLQRATDHGPSFWVAVRAFREGDAYIALPGGFRSAEELLTRFVGWIASFFVPAKQTILRQAGHTD